MSLKTAIGTKIIRFEPMMQHEFYWEFKKESLGSPDIPGYHVQYDNPDGRVYDSWSPKDVFEAAYTDVSGELDFGQAYFMMKQGKYVKRDGDTRTYTIDSDGDIVSGGFLAEWLDVVDMNAKWRIVDA